MSEPIDDGVSTIPLRPLSLVAVGSAAVPERLEIRKNDFNDAMHQSNSLCLRTRMMGMVRGGGETNVIEAACSLFGERRWLQR